MKEVGFVLRFREDIVGLGVPLILAVITEIVTRSLLWVCIGVFWRTFLFTRARRGSGILTYVFSPLVNHVSNLNLITTHRAWTRLGARYLLHSLRQILFF
jgi:hypothetical protein